MYGGVEDTPKIVSTITIAITVELTFSNTIPDTITFTIVLPIPIVYNFHNVRECL